MSDSMKAEELRHAVASSLLAGNKLATGASGGGSSLAQAFLTSGAGASGGGGAIPPNKRLRTGGGDSADGGKNAVQVGGKRLSALLLALPTAIYSYILTSMMTHSLTDTNIQPAGLAGRMHILTL